MSKDKDEPLVMVPLSYLKSNVTLRQWYAGMALQGMTAYCGVHEIGGHLHDDTDIGRKAFIIADAMIKAGGEE